MKDTTFLQVKFKNQQNRTEINRARSSAAEVAKFQKRVLFGHFPQEVDFGHHEIHFSIERRRAREKFYKINPS